MGKDKMEEAEIGAIRIDGVSKIIIGQSAEGADRGCNIENFKSLLELTV